MECFSSKDTALVFQCAVCLEVPVHPVATPCQHLFCKECLAGLWQDPAICC